MAAIFAQISTHAGFCGNICPDVQEIQFPYLCYMSWPSLDVPSSLLGMKKLKRFWVESVAVKTRVAGGTASTFVCM